MWVASVNLVSLKFCPEYKLLMKYSSMLETKFIKTKASLLIFQIIIFLKCPIPPLHLSQVVQLESVSMQMELIQTHHILLVLVFFGKHKTSSLVNWQNKEIQKISVL